MQPRNVITDSMHSRRVAHKTITSKRRKCKQTRKRERLDSVGVHQVEEIASDIRALQDIDENNAIIIIELESENEDCDAACRDIEAGNSLSPHCSDERVEQDHADLAAACEPVEEPDICEFLLCKENFKSILQSCEPQFSCEPYKDDQNLLIARASTRNRKIKDVAWSKIVLNKPTLTYKTQRIRHKDIGHFNKSPELPVINNLSNNSTFTRETRSLRHKAKYKDIGYFDKRPIVYKCRICKKHYKQRFGLQWHMHHNHTGLKPYSCDICKRKFLQERHLDNHRQRIHTGKNPYSCDICKKECPGKRSLAIHRRIHTGEKPFDCHICKMQFRVKYYLVNHLRVHSGKMLYSCGICKKQFNRKSSFINHQSTHSIEIKCDICKKEFTQKSNLILHMRTHTGEKPFCCEYCGKQFIVEGQLTSHLRTHTDTEQTLGHRNTDTIEKPFSCGICKKRFSRNRGLVKHQINNHGVYGRVFLDQASPFPASVALSPALQW